MTEVPVWVLEKLDARAAEVAAVDLGGGSNAPASSALYRAAYALGQYAPHLISRAAVADRLVRAATAERRSPMRPAEAERTVDKGLDEGMANPWFPTKIAARRTSPTVNKRTNETPKSPPDPREVVALWSSCVSVLADPEVSAWLRARKIDPERVDADALAFALPKNVARLPRWAKSSIGGVWRTWAESGHRLVLPLVDVEGNLRSVLARDVTGQHREKKSLSPLGHTRRGFFMRDPAARLVLFPEQARDDVPELAGPERWHDDAPERRFVIVEGEKKYLQHATLASDAAQHASATIGIFSGSWTDDLGALIPNGWTVRIAVDPDGSAEGKSPSGGLLYATKIMRSLEQRHRQGLVRVRWGREFAPAYDERGRLVFRLSDAVRAAG